jgi:hypothetical protein
LADTRQVNDSEEGLIIAETATTPGFDIEFIWERLYNHDWVILEIIGHYEGSASHNVKVQYYDYDLEQWTDLTAETQDIPNETTNQTYYWLPVTLTDTTRFKFKHTSAGDSSHRFYIDLIHLTEPIGDSLVSWGSDESSDQSSDLSSAGSSLVLPSYTSMSVLRLTDGDPYMFTIYRETTPIDSDLVTWARIPGNREDSLGYNADETWTYYYQTASDTNATGPYGQYDVPGSPSSTVTISE